MNESSYFYCLSVRLLHNTSAAFAAQVRFVAAFFAASLEIRKHCMVNRREWQYAGKNCLLDKSDKELYELLAQLVLPDWLSHMDEEEWDALMQQTPPSDPAEWQEWLDSLEPPYDVAEWRRQMDREEPEEITATQQCVPLSI